MPGSPFQKRKYGKVAVRIGCHVHVEMVAEEIAFPMGVPSPVAVGLGIMTLAAAGRTAVLLTIASSFFPLLCGSADRGTVTGKCQMLRMDQSSVDGLIQKLVFVKLENKKKGILRLWQQKEQNIFGRIRKLLQGGKIPEKKVEPFVFEPEPEINMHQQNPTVLLADLPKKEYGILKYEGNGTCSELSIDHTPYIIGSELDCDGVIPSGTVSRHHARITRKGEVYFIEDLNSSNGTMVGGELLNCRVKMSLQAQETVMFADEKFRFI